MQKHSTKCEGNHLKVKSINVSMIGEKFIDKAHSHAYRGVTMFSKTETIPAIRVIRGGTEPTLTGAAKGFGWESYETSWQKIIQRDNKRRK